MAALEHERLSLVFATRPDIIQGIAQAADTPERITLFNTITSFISDTYLSPDSEPSAKRRRIDAHENGVPVDGHGMMAPPPPPAPTAQAAAAAAAASTASGAHPSPTSGAGSLLIDLANAASKEVLLLEIKEVSVSIPQRKKYDLCFTKNYLYTKIMGTTAPVQGMVYKWSEIEYVFYVPIPEKQQLQHNYILFPRNTALSSTKSWPTVDFEPLLFTVPNTAPKAGVVSGFAAQTAAQVSDSYTNLMHWAINSQLTSVGNNSVAIVGTDARIFSSAVRQPHRPSEPAVHVKAHRGSKDGFLFFLPNGILWGYKKPLLFLPLDRIVALSYTNVLQRTFNVEVEVDVSHAPPAAAAAQDGQQKADNDASEMKTEVIEFAMIDQEDYQRIDETYVRRHGLNNRSMAEGRRAKRQLRENAPKGGGAGAGEANGAAAVEGQEAGGVGGEDDDMAELDRAEQLLEDEEDEEEEDYDPGSEGESEGEGETSEEEDDEEGGDEGEAEGYDEDGMEEEGYAEDHE